jgi:hypothetical protein
MRTILMIGTTLLATAFVAACVDQTAPSIGPGAAASDQAPAFASAPSDGNGNKLAVAFEDDFPVACPTTDVLEVHIEGWFQGRTFDQVGNPNVVLEVFHALITFTNSAGETYDFHDIGPDHYYLQDGTLFLAFSGHSAGSNVIGHVVVNVDTGETVEFVAGRGFGSPVALACEALT